MNKKTAQIIHCKNRFKQRYGGTISEKQLAELSKDVQLGYCQPIAEVSSSREIFKSGEWIFCYDKTRKQVCTFITKDMIPTYIQKEQDRSKRLEFTGVKNYKNEFVESINQELLQKFL